MKIVIFVLVITLLHGSIKIFWNIVKVFVENKGTTRLLQQLYMWKFSELIQSPNVETSCYYTNVSWCLILFMISFINHYKWGKLFQKTSFLFSSNCECLEYLHVFFLKETQGFAILAISVIMQSFNQSGLLETKLGYVWPMTLV